MAEAPWRAGGARFRVCRSSAGSCCRIACCSSRRSAGIDPQRADQRLAGALVDVECLRLPSGAVEREHQLATQLLAERVLLHQALQLTDELGMPAAGQVAVDPLLQTAEMKLLQTGDLTRAKCR